MSRFCFCIAWMSMDQYGVSVLFFVFVCFCFVFVYSRLFMFLFQDFMEIHLDQWINVFFSGPAFAGAEAPFWSSAAIWYSDEEEEEDLRAGCKWKYGQGMQCYTRSAVVCRWRNRDVRFVENLAFHEQISICNHHWPLIRQMQMGHLGPSRVERRRRWGQ